MSQLILSILFFILATPLFFYTIFVMGEWFLRKTIMKNSLCIYCLNDGYNKPGSAFLLDVDIVKASKFMVVRDLKMFPVCSKCAKGLDKEFLMAAGKMKINKEEGEIQKEQ